jgi:hypothetical protein
MSLYKFDTVGKVRTISNFVSIYGHSGTGWSTFFTLSSSSHIPLNYDNNTGAPTVLTGGTFGDAHAAVTLTVSVNGQEFDFSANGKMLGTVNDSTYGNGTVGIAVAPGGIITASSFVLSTTP